MFLSPKAGANEKSPAGRTERLSLTGFVPIGRETAPASPADHLGRVYRCNPTSAAARQPITHHQACTGLHSDASWEQIGNSIGNVSPMRPQCEITKVATCEPWIRRL